VFVISDLHLGGSYADRPGERGFRINLHVDQLVRFVDEIRQSSARNNCATELVINGDFLDFLAEEASASRRRRSFIDDEDEAVAALDALAARDEQFFTSLRRLVASDVMLTILLGNHDIELSFPAVRKRLASILGTEPGRGFQFLYDGEAYTIGDVLIEHGNRYDPWNVVDHDRLRRFRSECSRRLQTSDQARFFPPAGSQLVERVMNPIKEDYPFIDLLKPETEAAVPLLLALEPSLATLTNAIEAFRLRQLQARHGLATPVRPAHPGDIAGGRAGGQPLESLRRILNHKMARSESEELLSLLEEVERTRAQEAGDIAAGVVNRLFSFARLRVTDSYESRLRILGGALRSLQEDRSFDRSCETASDYASTALELTKNGFSTIVFGHTHLAKETSLCGGAKYINTGTWADLIRVPGEIIRSPAGDESEHLSRFADALRNKKFDDYLVFQPTFAHILLDSSGKTVSASLQDYKPGEINAP
jgi:UDP-2,3-diacylglucosamine pyrophosphatase LpxH